MLYNQPTLEPTAKMKAVGIAGALSMLLPFLVAILAQMGVIVPDDLQADVVSAISSIVFVYSVLQAVVQFVAGYMKRSNK